MTATPNRRSVKISRRSDLGEGRTETVLSHLVELVTISRIGFAMGRDGLLPQSVAQVSPRFGTPTRLTIVVVVVVAAIAALVPLKELAEMVSIGALFAFLLVSAAVPILWRTKPDVKRPFRVPFSPLIPILSGLACVYLMLNLVVETWIRFLVWLALGLVIYFAYGRRNARLAAKVVGEK